MNEPQVLRLSKMWMGRRCYKIVKPDNQTYCEWVDGTRFSDQEQREFDDAESDLVWP